MSVHSFPSPTGGRLPVAVLGATGAVGQRLLARLAAHPWFEPVELVASDRSAGRLYRDAVRWLLPGEISPSITSRAVLGPSAPLTSRLVFSALDAGPAREIEPRLAAEGRFVVSNASAHRMRADVPLLIPEINAGDLRLVDSQPWAAAGGGLVTNPNCCVAGLALALAPLRDAFGIEGVTVVTLQALSGAGYPGVASLDALGNVIPFIRGEEEKIPAETTRILGVDFPVSVAVNRVPVEDGHTESVFVRLRHPASLDEIRASLARWRGDARARALPSAPELPLALLDGEDRPQPRRDVNRGGGMTVSIGRIREDLRDDIRFTLLVHNTERGAAGAALLNGELLAASGRLGTLAAREAAS